MLDINYIREHEQVVRQAMLDKQLETQSLDELLSIDQKRRKMLQKVEEGRSKVNKNAAKIKTGLKNGSGRPDEKLVQLGKQLKEDLKKIEAKLKAIEEAFNEFNLQIPNVPAADVPVGKDETGNQVIRQVGEKIKFNFPAKTHEELMEALDLVDVKRAVKIGGFRSYILKNEAVLLEQALLNFALKILVEEGFTPMTVPVLVKKEAMTGTGYFPWGKQDHYYTQDEQILAGTSEVALTSFHSGEVLREKDLPVKMAGISPCFRREVGTYGKDTKGIIRVHQFNKIEQVVYTVADEEVTSQWHEKMVALSERLLQDLAIPYQVLLMCTGDMGAGQRKKYDIESWFPGQNKYRETHSASYFNDFQARRLNMKYRAIDGTTKFVYTLNNTMAASPRLLAAVIENYQKADGSIGIPKVLQPWMGKDLIKRP